jgi:hypothetical protein
MPDYLLLMHDDTADAEACLDWDSYLGKLCAAGVFQGGSAIGAGECMRRGDPVPEISGQIVGFIRITAQDICHARQLVPGNPVYEAGGTVEIRELPSTD